jgi:3-keto-disaccharide hydrolase
MTKTCLALAALALLVQDSPFNGKDLTGWKPKNAEKSKWKVGKASLDSTDNKKLALAEGNELINAAAKHGDSVDLSSEAKWGDALYEIELMVPKGSNSGVYVMGEYEVQVLDSFGKPNEKMGQGDIGALYGAAAPKLNASKAPGEWQKFVIDFRAPKFDADGKKTGNAKFLKIELNGQVVQENVEMKGPTPGGLTGKEAPTGPLMFQGDHGPVAYRNIKVTPVK